MTLNTRITSLSSLGLILSCVLLAACVTEIIQQKQPRLISINNPGMMMTNTAKGTFQVKLDPQALHDKQADASMARMSIDKQFTGDLEATSKGEMLSARSAVSGSAGYVAMERVTGTLNKRKGSFVLQHTGTMNRGAPSLNVSVVPDSGTDELAGLKGTMNIIITPGVHSYEFQYTLTKSP
jgi:Protein of unknown function (DUF3224)